MKKRHAILEKDEDERIRREQREKLLEESSWGVATSRTSAAKKPGAGVVATPLDGESPLAEEDERELAFKFKVGLIAGPAPGWTTDCD